MLDSGLDSGLDPLEHLANAWSRFAAYADATIAAVIPSETVVSATSLGQPEPIHIATTVGRLLGASLVRGPRQ